MNYKKHYDKLIETRSLLNRSKGDGNYYELHHIIARSMGGLDTEDNLVLLTAKEHFIAHFLLWRIHRNRSMAMAFNFMCNRSTHKFSARTYAEAREAYSQHGHSDISKKKMSSIAKGKPKSLEHRQKMSETRKGRIPWSKGKTFTDEHKLKLSKAHHGRTITDETRQKLSCAAKGKKQSMEAITNRVSSLILNNQKRRDAGITAERPKRRKPLVYLGVEYSGIRAAIKAGNRQKLIYERIADENYADCYLL